MPQVQENACNLPTEGMSTHQRAASSETIEFSTPNDYLSNKKPRTRGLSLKTQDVDTNRGPARPSAPLPVSPTRWSSEPNLNETSNETFAELSEDFDPTLSTRQLLHTHHQYNIKQQKNTEDSVPVTSTVTMHHQHGGLHGYQSLSSLSTTGAAHDGLSSLPVGSHYRGTNSSSTGDYGRLRRMQYSLSNVNLSPHRDKEFRPISSKSIDTGYPTHDYHHGTSSITTSNPSLTRHHSIGSSYFPPSQMHYASHSSSSVNASQIKRATQSTCAGVSDGISPPASIGTGDGGGTHRDFDLSLWQRKHQQQLQQLQQQQLEAAALSSRTAPPRHTHHPYTTTTNIDHHHPHHADTMQPQIGTTGTVVACYDHIILEKDAIIERQQRKLKEFDTGYQYHEKETIPKDCDLDRLADRIQDLQFENGTLKSRIADIMEYNSDQKHLQRKLGKVEYEFEEYRLEMEKKLQRLEFENTELTNKLKNQTKESLSWHQKNGELQEKLDEQSNKISSLERYMADLPTAESRHQHAQQINKLQEEKSRYKGRILELDRKINDAHKKLKQQEELLQLASNENELLKQKINMCEKEKKKLKERCDRAGPSQEDLDACRKQVSDLQEQLNSNKQHLELAQAELEQKTKQSKISERQIREQLQREEETVVALKQESDIKDQHLQKLRASVKELGAHNQELMNQKLSLQEQVHDLKTAQTGDMFKMQKRLYKELDASFGGLQSLVQICLDKTEGQEPNISLLLGATSMPTAMGITDDDKQDMVQGLKYRLSQAKELRQDIEELRKRISDRVADDMTKNITCAQQ